MKIFRRCDRTFLDARVPRRLKELLAASAQMGPADERPSTLLWLASRELLADQDFYFETWRHELEFLETPDEKLLYAFSVWSGLEELNVELASTCVADSRCIGRGFLFAGSDCAAAETTFDPPRPH